MARDLKEPYPRWLDRDCPHERKETLLFTGMHCWQCKDCGDLVEPVSVMDLIPPPPEDWDWGKYERGKGYIW